METFITHKEFRYSALHAAAANYWEDEQYPRLLDMLLQYYGEPKFLEAQATTQSRPTALQMAISSYNPVAVKALVAAGARLTDADTEDRTPLEFAMEMLANMVYRQDLSRGEGKIDRVERITTIIVTLAEKCGWPTDYESFPELYAALDAADVLLKKLMRSEHQVANMPYIKQRIFAIVNAGYSKMFAKLKLDGLELIRRVVMRRLAPALRMDIEYRVMPRAGITIPSDSFEDVRKRIPWCGLMKDNDLQQFQQAAAFEWFLDQSLNGTIPAENAQLSPNQVRDFARSANESDLRFDSELVQFPPRLLDWYKKTINKDRVTIPKEYRQQVQDFMAVLRSRDAARRQRTFPLPQFGKLFEEFHFDKLQPEKLDVNSAAAAPLLVTRCRCYFEPVGKLARPNVRKLCRKMACIDSDTWNKRLIQARQRQAVYVDDLSKWKQKVAIFDRHSTPASVLDTIQSAEMLNATQSLLADPEDTKDAAMDKLANSTPQNAPQIAREIQVPVVEFPYQELDFDNAEIRLLKLLPVKDSETPQAVECTMDHFSLSADQQTEPFQKYEKSVDKSSIKPFTYRKAWIETNGANRFVWGDFSCLSYSWGESSATKKILVNGHEVAVGINLEAALRSLRKQSQFRDGLLLWVDAICINQGNTSEKEKSVRDMQNIFSAAHSVTVWLGPGTEETDNAIRTISGFIARYSETSDSDENSLEVPLLPCPPLYYATTIYPAIVQLMDRRYWRRLWIMQELVACSPCEYVHIGDAKISWKELVLILRYAMGSSDGTVVTDEFTETHRDRVFRNINQAYVLASRAEVYKHLSGLGKQNSAFIHAKWDTWFYVGAYAETTDPRDRIYGLLGLLPNNISSRIHPNYSVSELEVYRSFSKTLFEASSSFDDIFRGTDATDAANTSWTIALRDFSSNRVINGQADKFSNNYTKLLEHSRTALSKVLKKLDGNEQYAVEVPYRFSKDGLTLTVLAIQVDTVAGISGSPARWANPGTVLNVPWKQSQGGLQPRDDTNEREALLRVLTANPECEDRQSETLLDIPFFDSYEPSATMIQQFRSNGWEKVLRSKLFHIFHVFRIQKRNFKLFGGKAFRDFFPATIGPCNEKAILEALEDTKKAAESTFITTERGHLGSTAVAVAEGDRVCVILGCSYPVLLRPDGDHFRVVGECYVDGYMEGQGIEYAVNGHCSAEETNLR
jgi:hypothetical protein